MPKYVLYGVKNAYRLTDFNNYNAYIQNAFKIVNFDDFETIPEVLEYIKRYFNINMDDIGIRAH